MSFSDLKLKKRPVKIHKAIIRPDFTSQTVLVSDPWDYVDLRLRRTHSDDALLYWQQAKHFFHASQHLPIISSPLTSYYCLLNATKALLSHSNIDHADAHGVSGERTISQYNSISNDIVTYGKGGVLGGLSRYLGEKTDASSAYSLKDIFLNLSFLHRAFCLTYKSQRNLFIPILNPRYVKKDGSKETWFCCEFEKQYSHRSILENLPSGYIRDEGIQNAFVIRKKRRINWERGEKHQKHNLDKLMNYHAKIRLDIVYIKGPMRLWYLKRRLANSNVIDRFPLTMMFAAMHRLSELARYSPVTLEQYLGTQANWLLAEFIEKAPIQFIDEIASEITGQEFMEPGIRK